MKEPYEKRGTTKRKAVSITQIFKQGKGFVASSEVPEEESEASAEVGAEDDSEEEGDPEVVKMASASRHFTKEEIEALDAGEYDADGFYILPDGAFIDNHGFYFDRHGKDQTGGHYEAGKYIKAR